MKTQDENVQSAGSKKNVEKNSRSTQDGGGLKASPEACGWQTDADKRECQRKTTGKKVHGTKVS